MTSSQWLDSPGPVRAGEDLDSSRLAEYLAESLPDMGSGPLSIEQFPSGYSNLTYLVRTPVRAVVLRRPPFGVEIATAPDLAREDRMLSSLRPVYPKVPRPLAFCGDPAVLGAPFYVMERVEGVILRRGIPDVMVPRVADFQERLLNFFSPKPPAPTPTPSN